jgi:hypothetical protein
MMYCLFPMLITIVSVILLYFIDLLSTYFLKKLNVSVDNSVLMLLLRIITYQKYYHLCHLLSVTKNVG